MIRLFRKKRLPVTKEQLVAAKEYEMACRAKLAALLKAGYGQTATSIVQHEIDMKFARNAEEEAEKAYWRLWDRFKKEQGFD